jgi:hypothetical protein
MEGGVFISSTTTNQIWERKKVKKFPNLKKKIDVFLAPLAKFACPPTNVIKLLSTEIYNFSKNSKV